MRHVIHALPLTEGPRGLLPRALVMALLAPSSNVGDLLRDLAIQAPGVTVSQQPLDRLGYSGDATPLTFLERRAGIIPQGPGAVVWPGTTQDVVTLVKLAGKHGVPLFPFGAGSGVVGGLRPRTGGVVVDVKRFGHVTVDATARCVEAGAGVLGERLERALNASGFTAGHFPSSIYCSTVGGWVAARSAGQLSSRYGKIEDMILALEAVDGAGRVFMARRGDVPDLLRAIVGSEGSLAIITRAWLRIHPLQSHHAIFGLAAPNVTAGLTFMRQVMQAGLRPSVFRMYDPPDTMLAGGIPKQSPAPLVLAGPISRAGHEDGSMRGPSYSGNAPANLFDVLSRRATAALKRQFTAGRATPLVQGLVGRALSRTDWLHVPYARLPTHCLMVMGVEGESADVEEALEHALSLARANDVKVTGRAPGDRWLKRRHAVTYKMPPFLRAGGWADTLEVSASWSVVEPLYFQAREVMLRHAVTLAHFSHAYAEGGSIYFTLAGGSAPGLDAALAAHDAAVEDALAVFARLGASLSHHHGAGRMKLAQLQHSLGPGARDALMRLKNALDPHGILNPGVLGLGVTP